MNKKDLYQIGKKDYFLDDFLIEKILLKNVKISKSDLFFTEEINENLDNIFSDFQKFKDGTPIEYILGHAEFYSLDFFVDNRVLIPRNDTEVLVNEALKSIKDKEYILIDVGTGSSCIPISILKNVSNKPKYTYVVDISDKALEVSKINLERHFLQNEVTQLKSDLLGEFLNSSIFNFQITKLIITANLPYIKNEDIDNMDDGVFFFEPNIALFGGKKTGFELYEKLISQIFEIKKLYNFDKILLFIEIGFDQFEYSKNYLSNLGLKFEYFKDIGGIERIVKIEF